MRNRIISCSAFVFIIVIIFSSIPVFAEGGTTTLPSTIKQETLAANGTEKAQPSTLKTGNVKEGKLTTLELKAVVPTDFSQTILVNFSSEVQGNIMARLDHDGKYSFSSEVKPGIYKLDFINVVGENAVDYNIKSAEQLVVKDGEIAKFNIELALKPNARKSESSSEKTKQTLTEEDVKQWLNEDKGTGTVTTQSHNVITPDPSLDTSNSAVKDSPKPQFAVDPSTTKTIIWVSILIVIGLLVFVYKQLRYKHDYYDC
ncbi:hypothetical protein [Paenibacillus sp. SN-8-1]|uniref:hypothetical protein n=1 Tax=Paenibacillus sp. SN-8-1 TaxID=3435409 RepID=UPI003D9A7031